MLKRYMKRMGILFVVAAIMPMKRGFADEFDDKIQAQQQKLQQIEQSKLAESQTLANLITEQNQVANQIDSVQQEIARTQDEMTQLIEEITNLEEIIAKRSERIHNQARNIQVIDGGNNVLEAIFSSESIVEAISRITAMSQITGNSLEILQQQQKDKEMLLVKQNDIEKTAQKQQQNISNLTQLKQNLASNVIQAQLVLADMDLQGAKTQDEISALRTQKAEVERLQREAEMRLAAQREQEAIAAQAKRVAEQQAQAQAVAVAAQQAARTTSTSTTTSSGGTNSTAATTSNTGFIYPISNPTVTSHFGESRTIGSYSDVHSGVDFVNGNPNAVISAAGVGTVVYSGNSGLGGLTVIIKHANGFNTYYMHLSSISVSVGQQVAQGQQLGIIGTTGMSTGIHLHFGMSRNLWSGYVNPLNYL